MRVPTLLLGLSLFAACGGGGGSGGGGATGNPLTLVLATFVGPGATPAAGDELQLQMSGNFQLTGSLLDDGDVTMSAGTLGTVTAPPGRNTARLIRVTLGAGVTFTPGMTSIGFGPGNDAVQAPTGSLPGAALRVISKGDGDSPTITLLTLNTVDAPLNGTGAAGGVLQVPPNRFTIDISHTDPSSSPIAAISTIIEADVIVNTPAGIAPPGTNLAPFLTATSGAGLTSFRVPGNVSFPPGPASVLVFVVDSTGMVSNPATMPFTVRPIDDLVRPFETTQVWFLDTSRDIESFTHDINQVITPVQVNAGANGRPDLHDLYFVLGLLGNRAAVNVTVLNQIEQETLARLADLYAGVDTTFTFDSPGSFPQGATSVPYNSFGFSQICLAGAESDTGTSGVLGVALFDPNNTTQDDNCQVAFSGFQRLGVFMHTMVNDGLRQLPSSLFRQTFSAFVPGFPGGVPIGEALDTLDPGRLSGAVNDPRATAIGLAIDRIASSIAVITAHECGHSVGLVEDNVMPNGLYGGNGHFSGSTPGHIRNVELFPPGAINVMTPVLSFGLTVNAGTAFNGLNLAYLREQVLYN